MKITFGNFTVTNVKQTSGVFSGDNSQVKWKNVKKVNEGFGRLVGSKNVATENQHVVKKHVKTKKGLSREKEIL